MPVMMCTMLKGAGCASSRIASWRRMGVGMSNRIASRTSVAYVSCGFSGTITHLPTSLHHTLLKNFEKFRHKLLKNFEKFVSEVMVRIREAHGFRTYRARERASAEGNAPPTDCAVKTTGCENPLHVAAGSD